MPGERQVRIAEPPVFHHRAVSSTVANSEGHNVAKSRGMRQARLGEHWTGSSPSALSCRTTSSVWNHFPCCSSLRV